jgi:hypothetical protein
MILNRTLTKIGFKMSETTKKRISWVTTLVIAIATIINVIIVTPLVKDRQYEVKQIGDLRESVSKLTEIMESYNSRMDNIEAVQKSKADKETTELKINLCKEEVINIVRTEIRAGDDRLINKLQDAGILIYGSNK